MRAKKYVDIKDNIAMITLHNVKRTYRSVMEMKRELQKNERDKTKQYWNMVSLLSTVLDEGYIGNGDYIYKIDRIPSDEEVFQTIRESGRMIRIGDREIPPSKLDTEFFTIYWYSFKSEMSDGWHIDGRIVAKNGYLTVKKDFVGMPEAIEEVKKDYYIQVDMDEKLLDGKPQPPAFHEHMKLVLPSEDSQKPDAEAPQAEDAPIEVVGTWTDDTHTSCTWIVKADSFWKYTLKEYNYKPKDSNVKFSGWYNVRNSHEQGDNVNSWEAYPESGIQFTGRGIGRGGETLTIELENRYQKEGILTLNKFDESTGQGMEKINFAVSKNGVEEETVTTDKYGIAQLHIPLQDENKQNRTATETYLLRETNLPTGYVDTGDIQITVEIANGAFKITDAKLVDREANENQEAVKAPVDGKIDGKSVLLQRGDTSLNIRNFAKTGTLHIKKTWENPNDALTEKQVKIRLYQNGISTGQEFLLNEENGWEHTVDNVPLFQDRNPVEYKVEEIEIGKTHYSLEYGDGFLYYEVIYPEIQYFDSNGQQIFPKDENEFKDVSKMELEVQNLHFNLAERSFLKTDDLPRNRLAGAGFLFYKVPYDDVTKEYADDTGYTVDYECVYSHIREVYEKARKTENYEEFISQYVERYVYASDKKMVQDFLSSEGLEERLVDGCMEKDLPYRRITGKDKNAYVWMEAKKYIDANENTAIITLHNEKIVQNTVIKMERELIKKEQDMAKQYWDMVSLLTTLLNHNHLVEAGYQDDISFYTKQVYLQLQNKYPEYGITDEEMNVVKQHPLVGAAMTQRFPEGVTTEKLNQYSYEICRHHHERYDGSGYPDGLKGNAIPMCAQVVGIVDAYDALINDRPYKRKYEPEEAIQMISNGECGAFSNQLMQCFQEAAKQQKWLKRKKLK